MTEEIAAINDFAESGMPIPKKVNWLEVDKDKFDELKSKCDPNGILYSQTWIFTPKSTTVYVNYDASVPDQNPNFMVHWFMHNGDYEVDGTQYFVNDELKNSIVVPTEHPKLKPEDFPPVPQEVLDRIKAYEEAKARGETVEGT